MWENLNLKHTVVETFTQMYIYISDFGKLSDCHQRLRKQTIL